MNEIKEVHNIESGVKSVTIKHVEGLTESKPIPLNVTGNIDTVFQWLNKRWAPDASPESQNWINGETAHVIINRDKMTITLVVNEQNPHHKGTITGALQLHTDFAKWEINTGKEYDNKTLAEFIKMNRNCFVSKGDAMKLSAELSNLKVKVDKEFEKANDNRGNTRQLVAQNVIDMNIPKTFKMSVPIFKGQAVKTFEVEIYVNPNTYQVSLVSPDVNDIIATERDMIINGQKEAIAAMADSLVIIEQ